MSSLVFVSDQMYLVTSSLGCVLCNGNSMGLADVLERSYYIDFSPIDLKFYSFVCLMFTVYIETHHTYAMKAKSKGHQRSAFLSRIPMYIATRCHVYTFST